MAWNTWSGTAISFLALLSSLPAVLAGCDNSKVLPFPVQNVLLSNGKNMRGIPLSAGTPSQAFALLPQPFYNDTWLYNTTVTFCTEFGSLQTSGCITQRGGLYDWESSSSSAKPPTDVYNAGGDPSDTIDVIGQGVTGSSFIKDILLLPNSISLAGFPIGMPGLSLNTFYNTQGALGIGSNSTILNALLAAGKIASRSYSWWWGLDSAVQTAQMDGQFILGGYDAAKVKGRNYTKALVPPAKSCHTGMLVTISDMVLQFPNGTSASFLSPNVLTTCILPEYPLMAYFPWIPYFNTFEALTSTSNLGHGGGNGLTFEGMLYPTDNVFEGSLTISLSDDFSITFSNDLLVVPPASVRPNGSILRNQTVAEVLLGPLAGSDTTDLAILGRYFFQAAYLTVDYDANTFTISQANAVADSNLVSLSKDCASSDAGSGPGTSSPSSSSNNGNPKASSPTAPMPKAHSSGDQNSAQHNAPFSTAAIVGVVVGGVCLIGLTAVVTTLLCLRRRKAGRAQHGDDDTNHTSKDMSPRESPYIGNYQEAMSKDILEMQSRRSEAELAAWSKPLELRTDRLTRVQQHGYWQSSPVELG